MKKINVKKTLKLNLWPFLTTAPFNIEFQKSDLTHSIAVIFFHFEESFALKRPAQDQTLAMSSKFVLGVSLFADGMPKIADNPPTPSERHHPIPETPQPQRSQRYTHHPQQNVWHPRPNTLWTNPLPKSEFWRSIWLSDNKGWNLEVSSFLLSNGFIFGELICKYCTMQICKYCTLQIKISNIWKAHLHTCYQR